MGAPLPPSKKCLDCKHLSHNLKGKTTEEGIESDWLVACGAFPNGIPNDILEGYFDHTKKHPDQDNDIVFEPVKEN